MTRAGDLFGGELDPDRVHVVLVTPPSAQVVPVLARTLAGEHV